ncbi:endoribonuclease, L-PSP family protein [Oceanicola granulosus HTCC2516]|uniref:Endoribonuclease, L-PSP family protein n=1 Tax=Oceanicola granulosus (strain ATCC BAA-861 / DSM 15982 / KCTC 12143 / HTCC2516) TaxID=314256 RepID=Q2CEP4_OCEGH|nr:RidA family protein [Oceanicola granulosus]EAR51088.1 endoribonuclease, L-PSP family protein [Oceanicola granulosus HTCC2516]
MSNELNRIQSGKRMSQVVEVPAERTMLYFAGQIASDRTLDLEGQTRDILDKLDSLLAEAGSDRTKIVSAMIWLSDIRNRHAFNPIWDAWIPEGAAPARACVEARLAEASDLVEIQITAVK